MVTQLVNIFPAFYGNLKFNSVLPRASHWSLSWARCINSTPSYPTQCFEIHFNIILPSISRSPKWSLHILYRKLAKCAILDCNVTCTLILISVHELSQGLSLFTSKTAPDPSIHRKVLSGMLFVFRTQNTMDYFVTRNRRRQKAIVWRRNSWV
jgi:hypothetical protein